MRFTNFYKFSALIFAVVFSIFFSLQALSQTERLNEIKNLNAKNDGSLEEKLFLHTDRSSYLCGEIIWFKAYVANSLNRQPLSLSKIVYVEILNKLNQPVLQGKIAMEDGNGDGSFFFHFQWLRETIF